MSAPAPAWLDHLTVLALIGVDKPIRFEPIHVVRVGNSWDAPRGVQAHRTNQLPARDLTNILGYPCVTPSRAFATAAVDIDAERLDDALDTAVRLKVYNAQQMLDVLSDRPTYIGVRRLTEGIARLDSTSGTFRSNFERRTKRLIERSKRIPQPVVNVLVEGFEPDLWWRGTRAIVECDGRDYHRSPAQIAKDERREAILRARGYVFLRLRWEDVVYNERRALAEIERFVLANMEPPRAQ